MKTFLKVVWAIFCFALSTALFANDSVPVREAVFDFVPVRVADFRNPAANYPVHGTGGWHIIGSANTKQEIINHLMTEPDHADVRAIYTFEDLQSMTQQQLNTLHGDSHNHQVVNVKQQTAVQKPVVRQAPVQYYQSGGCPGGVCPSPRRSRFMGFF